MSSALHIRKRPVRAVPQSVRAPRLAARRRRTRALAAFLGLLVILSALGGISFVSRLERLALRDVSVVGTQALSERSVAAAAQAMISDGAFHLLSRENMFLYPKTSVETELAKIFPRIERVSVSRQHIFSQTLSVHLTERRSFALWCIHDGECFLMDADGFIFAAAEPTELTESGYVFEGALAATESPVGQTFLYGRFDGIGGLLRRLRDAGFSPHTVSIENEQDISILFAEGYRMRASFGSDAGDLVRDLELVMSSDALKGQTAELDYVDLRFGDRVYYKFRQEDVVR